MTLLQAAVRARTDTGCRRRSSRVWAGVRTAKPLVAQAVSLGGRDDITTIVVDVLSGGATSAFDEITGSDSPCAASTSVDVTTAATEPTRARRG